MAQNHIIEWVGVTLLFIFGITMIIQGHYIYHGKYGYKHCERENERSRSTREQIEKLLKNK